MLRIWINQLCLDKSAWLYLGKVALILLDNVLCKERDGVWNGAGRNAAHKLKANTVSKLALFGERKHSNLPTLRTSILIQTSYEPELKHSICIFNLLHFNMAFILINLTLEKVIDHKTTNEK